jgi:hypothetical protein
MDTNLSDPRPLLLEVRVQMLVAASRLDGEKVTNSRKGKEGRKAGKRLADRMMECDVKDGAIEASKEKKRRPRVWLR